MIYGLYLSATGVLTNSYRQDVIANNIANSETVGFKRDLALFHERLTEAQENRLGPRHSNPLLEKLGGGLLASPTFVDSNQGEFEPTGNNLDVAIQGSGFFAVDDHGQKRLTRNGQFSVNRDGHLILSNGSGQKVLDVEGDPILLDPTRQLAIARDGQITQDETPVARIGLFEVPNPGDLRKEGGTLLSYEDIDSLRPATGTLRSEFIERANVDPASELALLMDAQRQLEANANMIRYQDQTLGRLVNDVGKIG